MWPHPRQVRAASPQRTDQGVVSRDGVGLVEEKGSPLPSPCSCLYPLCLPPIGTYMGLLCMCLPDLLRLFSAFFPGLKGVSTQDGESVFC